MEMPQNMFKHLLTTEVTFYQLCKLDLSYRHYLLLPMEYLLSMKLVISQLYKLNMSPLYLYHFILGRHQQYSSIHPQASSLLMNKLTTILDKLLLP
jgi:hypothetical protein